MKNTKFSVPLLIGIANWIMAIISVSQRKTPEILVDYMGISIFAPITAIVIAIFLSKAPKKTSISTRLLTLSYLINILYIVIYLTIAIVVIEGSRYI